MIVTVRRKSLQFINKCNGVIVYNDTRRKGAAYVANGYKNLRIAILIQAIDDYKIALIDRDNGEIRHLENFFLSDWGEMLSGCNGELIIEIVRKDIKHNVRK